MGQQQLLLIVLGAIIVGIAIIVGLNMFSSGAAQANLDAVTQDVMTISSRAQEWWRKPAAMGGGGRTWTGLTSSELVNFPDTTANGNYQLSVLGGGAQLQVVGRGIEDGDGNGLNLQITTVIDSSAIVSTIINER